MLTSIPARPSIVGLNHQYPSLPQYNVSDKAAAVDTDARPNITITTDGKQHIDATMAEEEIHFQRPLSMPIVYIFH